MESVSHPYQDLFIDFKLSYRISKDEEGNPAVVNLFLKYICIYPTGATSSFQNDLLREHIRQLPQLLKLYCLVLHKMSSFG